MLTGSDFIAKHSMASQTITKQNRFSSVTIDNTPLNEWDDRMTRSFVVASPLHEKKNVFHEVILWYKQFKQVCACKKECLYTLFIGWIHRAACLRCKDTISMTGGDIAMGNEVSVVSER